MDASGMDILSESERRYRIERYCTGEIDYDAFVHLVLNCRGGCKRGFGRANPLLRPAGGFKIPSRIMFVFGRPTELDERENLCLPLDHEDLGAGGPDLRSISVRKICDILGISHRDIYACNSLLCWQPEDSADWRHACLPCLERGWLYHAIELCNPHLIVTFGREALRSVNYVLGGPLEEPCMAESTGNPFTLRGIHIWPLADIRIPAGIPGLLAPRERAWYELAEYVKELSIAVK